MKAIVGIALCLLFIGGCASSARLYNLDTGEVLTAIYKDYGTGHGEITVTTPEGNKLVGEYTTISGAMLSSGFGSASVSGTGGYAWATAQGFSISQPGAEYGSATVAGAGLVIDLLYVVDPWSGHGHGVGRDNRGGRYTLQF